MTRFLNALDVMQTIPTAERLRSEKRFSLSSCSSMEAASQIRLGLTSGSDLLGPTISVWENASSRRTKPDMTLH